MLYQSKVTPYILMIISVSEVKCLFEEREQLLREVGSDGRYPFSS